MRIGEPVQTLAGESATVVAIRVVPGAAAMWDLTVSNLHDFAVGAGEYVVHNAWCKVNYGSNDLSSEIKARRIGPKDALGNYAGAVLDNGEKIFAKSNIDRHAEEALVQEADARGRRIAELYSEREPCSRTCGPLLKQRGITNVSWSWDWNGLNHAAVSAGMRAFFRSLW